VSVRARIHEAKIAPISQMRSVLTFVADIQSRPVQYLRRDAHMPSLPQQTQDRRSRVRRNRSWGVDPAGLSFGLGEENIVSRYLCAA